MIKKLGVATALAGLAAASALFLTSGDSAGYYWVGGFDVTQDFTQWTTIHQGDDGDCCRILTEKGGRNYVAQMWVESGDQFDSTSGERAELVKADPEFNEVEGEEEQWRWFVRFPPDGINGFNMVETSGLWNYFTQWHHNGSKCSPPVSFTVASSTEHIFLQTKDMQDYDTCTFTRRDFDLGLLQRDHWYKFDFHVIWSSDPTKGLVDLDVDDVNVVPPTHVATMYAGFKNYLTQGYYNPARPVGSLGSRVFLDATRLISRTP